MNPATNASTISLQCSRTRRGSDHDRLDRLRSRQPSRLSDPLASFFTINGVQLYTFVRVTVIIYKQISMGGIPSVIHFLDLGKEAHFVGMEKAGDQSYIQVDSTIVQQYYTGIYVIQ